MEDDEVGGVGNREDEAGRVCDKSAGEQIGHGLSLCALDRGEHSGSEHHGSGVVGHEDRNNGSDEVNEGEEVQRRSVCMPDSDVGQPVEYAVIARKFGEEHHSGKKEVDVKAFGDGSAGEIEGDEAKCAKENRSGTCPVDLRQTEWSQEHQHDAECGDDPDEGMGEQSLLLLSNEPGSRTASENLTGSWFHLFEV